MDKREIKYLYIRSLFSTRKDAISDYRERFGIASYMKAKDKQRFLAINKLIDKYKRKPVVAMTREERIADYRFCSCHCSDKLICW